LAGCGRGLCVGVGAEMLLTLRTDGPIVVLIPVLAVVATDIGAYFAGRTFGGPKIAPKISPSKTWSGLFGGMVGAGTVVSSWMVWGMYHADSPTYDAAYNSVEMGAFVTFIIGAFIAIIAQTGDFFESWMKRRAGVKDSGHLIPGHGGLFDRVDGLLAVLFVAGIFGAVVSLVGPKESHLVTLSTVDK
jgi:phosphatidate cytidylyltransferase